MYALEILRHFNNGEETVSRTRIMEGSHIPRSTLTRLLGNLVSEGYITKVAHGRYAPGPHFQRLAERSNFAPGKEASKEFIFIFRESVTAGQMIFQGISEALRERNMRCRIHPVGWSLDNAQEEALRLLEDVDGAFFFTFQPLVDPFRRWALESGHPSVHIGLAEFDCCDTVTWDMEGGFGAMTRCLLEAGCEDVIYVGTEDLHRMRPFYLRRKGYVEAMKRAGLEPRLEQLNYGDYFKTTVLREKLGALIQSVDFPKPIALVLPQESGIQPLAMTLEGMGSGFRERILLCSPVMAPDPASRPRFAEELALELSEPWIEVGRAACRRLLNRLDGDGAAPLLTLVQAPVVERLPTALSSARANKPENQIDLKPS
jgi:hypothetical protein